MKPIEQYKKIVHWSFFSDKLSKLCTFIVDYSLAKTVNIPIGMIKMNETVENTLPIPVFLLNAISILMMLEQSNCDSLVKE